MSVVCSDTKEHVETRRTRSENEYIFDDCLRRRPIKLNVFVDQTVRSQMVDVVLEVVHQFDADVMKGYGIVTHACASLQEEAVRKIRTLTVNS